MRVLISKYPIVIKFFLAIILFALVLFVSGLVNKGFVKQYFPYVSCLLLVVATWMMYKIEHKSLKAIGLNFSWRNLSFLPLGVLVGLLALFGASFFKAIMLGETLNFSISINLSTILLAFYYILPQVATEELLFRGYLFKKTIEVSNVAVANVLFSILFMLIHVLDKGVLNNKAMIILVVVSIPVGHLLFATALLKSRTLFFPIGIHLGNNWATRHLISNTNSGDSIFYLSNVNSLETWASFIVFLILFNGFFLLVTLLIWKWDKITVFR